VQKVPSHWKRESNEELERGMLLSKITNDLSLGFAKTKLVMNDHSKTASSY
jgi:hypothetical protein